MNRVPPELRTLCNRLATERLRLAHRRAAGRLRREVEARLQAGEDADALAREFRLAVDLAGATASYSTPAQSLAA